MKRVQLAIDDGANRGLVILEAVNKLKSREYKLKFRREVACLYCFELREWIMPEDFTVDESYYFGDLLQPDADRILYAISLTRGLKGFLIDTCNVYADNISGQMLQQLYEAGSYKNNLNKAITIKNQVNVFDHAFTF